MTPITIDNPRSSQEIRRWSITKQSPNRSIDNRQCHPAPSPTPKLFINAEPGALVVGPRKEIVRRWPNTTEVTVTGRHYLQEESPEAIGSALATWIGRLS